MSTPRDCSECQTPAPYGDPRVVVLGDPYRPSATDRPAHRACLDNPEAARSRACEEDRHWYPGRWTRDPGDPYGDASYWECTREGCTHVQRHEGYGTGRSILENLGPDAHREWLNGG